MGEYLPPGSCDKEFQAMQDGAKALDKAFRNYQSAEHNMQSGEVGTAAAGVGALGCLLLTGPGAPLCLAAAGLTMIWGELGILSGGEALINAEEDLDDAMDNLHKAAEATCKCLDSHMLSVPDE